MTLTINDNDTTSSQTPRTAHRARGEASTTIAASPARAVTAESPPERADPEAGQ
jgi:hypothetical protein